MSEDPNNPNSTEIPIPNANDESPSYKSATAIGNKWESTEVPLVPPPDSPLFESNHEVVAVSERRGFPIIIPLFIIVLGVFIGVTFLLFKQTQNGNIPGQMQTPSPISASPTVANLMQATPQAVASVSAVPTQTPSDTISDIENDLNKLDSASLDVP